MRPNCVSRPDILVDRLLYDGSPIIAIRPPTPIPAH